MKRSIAWHEEALANQRESLRGAAVRVEVAKTEYLRLCSMVGLRERQIAEAKRRGMDAFDAERLLISRKQPVAP